MVRCIILIFILYILQYLEDRKNREIKSTGKYRDTFFTKEYAEEIIYMITKPGDTKRKMELYYKNMSRQGS